MKKNKEKPNYGKVSSSMRATFGDRRNKIVLEQSSVARFLVLNGFKSLISLMNENVEDFFVKKELLPEESTTVIVYSGDSVAKSLIQHQ
ncbi:hypothetical protein Avbf_16326 [Armadillidium vulgare]|nr:hypothetical protein Avbf_16326 [Armadillidium vulgare]